VAQYFGASAEQRQTGDLIASTARACDVTGVLSLGSPNGRDFDLLRTIL
jgi:hypothetical protein